ncbi:hypothetical protein [Gryllotalpicola ginsengisoli]|uniref:hypothetical protein n=1 Tax=Gryllotalpicola ginsengisoli TaxID=444608 RepID=UPI0003B706EA|nr:hypothetical protein [Gryllotalpicola ginsengisoli]
MRFDKLFEDLEGQLETELAAQGAAREAEEERLRLARLTLRERLSTLAGLGSGIRAQLVDGSVLSLTPGTVGKDWFSADLADAGACIVRLDAVTALSLTLEQARASSERMPPSGAAREALAARIGVGVPLRDLARRRVPVDVFALGHAVPVHGTIDRVGADHLELAVHERGAARRARAVTELRLIALSALARVAV